MRKIKKGIYMLNDLLEKNKTIEKELLKLSLEELLEVEEIIMKIVKQKIRTQKRDEWKKDFLEISEWSHLKDKNEVKVDKWTIETF